MRRLALSGVIDFTTVDLVSPKFWQRLRGLLRTLYEQEQRELDALAFQRDLAMFQAVAQLKGQLSEVGAAIDSSFDRIRDRLQPWFKEQQQRAGQDTMRTMEEQYAKAWGDPNDPAVAARIEEAARKLGVTR